MTGSRMEQFQIRNRAGKSPVESAGEPETTDHGVHEGVENYVNQRKKERQG